ncbi:chalcone isomerase family protein [Bdellovibrio bacteriovorus]
MKHILVATLVTLMASVSMAALLTPSGAGPKVEGISLPATVSATTEGQTSSLSSVGAGLRSKKVVFVNVKVYVGQLFVSNPESFKKSDAEALTSLKSQKAAAIQLHFLRNVEADKVQQSFAEAFKANKVNTDDAGVKQFLTAVTQGGEAKEGKALTILGTKLADNTEVISYESTAGTVSEIKGGAGLIEKVFSIWLGKPSDDGVADLKKSILK